MGKIQFVLSNGDDEERHLFLKLTKHAKICVVTFSATWCGPCKVLAHKLESLVLGDADLHGQVLSSHDNMDTLADSVVFVKVDIDEYEDLAKMYGVSGIPHTVFFANGELDQDFVVGCDVEKIVNKVKSVF
jgi:thioredoxin